MSSFTLDDVTIGAIAAAVPSDREHNQAYDHIPEEDRAFLIKTIGVAERRIAPSQMTTSDLCQAAASEIISKCGLAKSEIGLLVFVSQSGDYLLPATAALLQHRLGLPKGTIAFDVGLGCSGYVYGLSIAASMMRSCNIQKALLLAGDTSSLVCSREDKSTYPLFGDAGSATLLEHRPSTSPSYFNLMTNGAGGDAILIPDGGARNKVRPDSFKIETTPEGAMHHRLHMKLNGPEIFSFAVTEVPPSVDSLLGYSKRELADVDYFVMHQANKLINETIRKKLGIPPEKTPYSLNNFGNTSSASIPLTMVTQMQEALQTSTLNVLMSGFGVGLSWGNALLTTDRIVCPSLLEL